MTTVELADNRRRGDTHAGVLRTLAALRHTAHPCPCGARATGLRREGAARVAYTCDRCRATPSRAPGRSIALLQRQLRLARLR